jgi:hypothetical protein
MLAESIRGKVHSQQTKDWMVAGLVTRLVAVVVIKWVAVVVAVVDIKWAARVVAVMVTLLTKVFC